MPLVSVSVRWAGIALLTSCLVAATLASAALPIPAKLGVPHYRKIVLSQEFLAEGGTFGDLNRDGKLDAIAGPYWYAGPDFTTSHELYPALPFDPLKYSENFCPFVHDFNGDGWPDVLIIGFPGKDASWLENPRTANGIWRRHLAFEPVDTESPTFGDLLGDGHPVLVCASGGRLGYTTPDARNPTQPWTFHPVTPKGPWERFTHGLGFGDVNGDSRADLIEKDGWWEQPADRTTLWKQHRVRFGDASQMYAMDVNGDGRADIVTSLNAHGYGLAWYEQLPTEAGEPAFRPHTILSANAQEKNSGVQFSQLHAVELADIDGDGLFDIVTGKRWWAHGPEHDPDPNGTPVLYAFLLRRTAGGGASFEPVLIDDASGVGTQLATADVNADGRPDILSVNKRGASVFLSGPSK